MVVTRQRAHLVTFALRRLCRFSNDTRGAALVEFAIVAPFLVLLLLGIIDWGRYLFLYNQLGNAVRDGARIAAVTASPSGNVTVISTVRSRINDTNAATAAVTVDLLGNVPEQTVRVTITSYPFRRLYALTLAPTQITSVAAEFRYELQ
jgi:Flp pilus assembly protein TadG